MLAKGSRESYALADLTIAFCHCQRHFSFTCGMRVEGQTKKRSRHAAAILVDGSRYLCRQHVNLASISRFEPCTCVDRYLCRQHVDSASISQFEPFTCVDRYLCRQHVNLACVRAVCVYKGLYAFENDLHHGMMALHSVCWWCVVIALHKCVRVWYDVVTACKCV